MIVVRIHVRMLLPSRKYHESYRRRRGVRAGDGPNYIANRAAHGAVTSSGTQLVEQRTENPRVGSSILPWPSNQDQVVPCVRYQTRTRLAQRELPVPRVELPCYRKQNGAISLLSRAARISVQPRMAPWAPRRRTIRLFPDSGPWSQAELTAAELSEYRIVDEFPSVLG